MLAAHIMYVLLDHLLRPDHYGRKDSVSICLARISSSPELLQIGETIPIRIALGTVVASCIVGIQPIPHLEAVAAIRPEDVAVRPSDRKEPGSVLGTVELVEFLGRDSELNIRSDLGDVVARTNGDWKPGDRISLLLPHQRLLVFAREDR
jgi:hypothetical protein